MLDRLLALVQATSSPTSSCTEMLLIPLSDLAFTKIVEV